MTHTPGPWQISPHSETGITAANNRGIATAGGYQNNMIDPDDLWEENVANAALIAAAPELLEAGELICDLLERGEQIRRTDIFPLRAAITKAEGAIK